MSDKQCTIAYRLRTDRFFVGAGHGTAVVDRTFMRDHLGRPFIPGTHVKGLVRHEVEKLLGALGFHVPEPHVPPGGKGPESHGPVGRLFGEPGAFDIRIQFSDLHLGGEDHATEVRRMVHLSRFTHRPVSKHLYDTEYARVGSGVSYDGFVRLWPKMGRKGEIPWEVTLLCAGLRLLRRIGGDKSTGSGWVEVEISDIRLGDRSLPLSDVLAPLLSEGWLQAVIQDQEESE